jgi:hypothetical protein
LRKSPEEKTSALEEFAEGDYQFIRRKDLFGLLVSEVSVHNHLTP